MFSISYIEEGGADMQKKITIYFLYYWGAFSNYYHDYKYHWSSVTRARDSKSSYAYAPSHQTSRAFINTNFGETVYFNYGFKKIHSS